MNEEDKQRIWRTILGYRIGEYIRVRYRLPVLIKEGIGKVDMFVEGKVVEIRKDSVIIEDTKGFTYELKENLIYGAEKEES